jgi:hypothetical protein
LTRNQCRRLIFLSPPSQYMHIVTYLHIHAIHAHTYNTWMYIHTCTYKQYMQMIDPMQQRSIIGSVGLLHGPGRQRSHASAGQPDRPEGEDQLTSHLGPCRRRTFRRTRRTNQMCSTNSLRLRRRHHRLPGIHRRRHSDRRAATLRGSGPASGRVAGLA